MKITDRIRRLHDRYRTKRRRRKLRRAYHKVACAELDKSHGFTPTIRTLELLEQDEKIDIEDGKIVWRWP